MSDSFEFTLHSPLTQEDWNKLTDAELENTTSITFQTPQGRQVKYIKCDVFDKIKAEIENAQNPYLPFIVYGCFAGGYYDGLAKALKIIDRHINGEGRVKHELGNIRKCIRKRKIKSRSK